MGQRRTLTLAFCALIMACPAGSARAQWLNLCAAEDPGTGLAGYLSHNHRDDRRFDRLTLTEDADAGPSCISREVAFAYGDVMWARITAAGDGRAGSRQIVLQGAPDGGRFRVGEVIAPEPSPPPSSGGNMVAPGFDLLPGLELAVFGEEDRARLGERDGAAVTLSCRAGSKAAGAVLSVSSALPQYASQHLVLRARGSGRFAVAYSDSRRHLAGAPIALGDLDASPAAERGFAFDLPQDRATRADWRSLTVVCPADGGELTLSSLRVEAATPHPRPGRASWYWSSSAWRQQSERIFAQQQQWRLRRIYVGVDVVAGSVGDEAAFRRFVARAREHRLEVWAVLGDPAAIGAHGQAVYRSHLQALDRYNGAASENARIDGIQLDIEAYLEPGYRYGGNAWKRDYLEAMAGLRSATGLPVEVVLPFWLSADPEFLEALAPIVSGLTVMNYRTDPFAITTGALPFLEWGGRHGKPVIIALETIPLPSQVRRHYEKAAHGELIAVDMAGREVLVLLDEPVQLDGATMFQWRSSVNVDFGYVSFFDQESRLIELMLELERQFGAWRAFGGLAIHGLDRVN